MTTLPISSSQSDRFLKFSVISMFALMFIAMPHYSDLVKLVYVMLILTGFFYLISNFRIIFETSNTERMFLAVVLLNFIWIAFTYYASDIPGVSSSFLWGRQFYLPFLIPLFFLFKKVQIPDKALMLTLVLGISLTLADILIDIGRGVDYRALGMNPNNLGPIQLSFSGILIAFYYNYPEKKWRWLAFAGFLLGITTVILTQSRGTWLALISLCLLFVFYISRNQPLWKRTLLVAMAFPVLSSFYLLPVVQSRVDIGIRNFNNYLQSVDRNDYSRITPTGLRLELWRSGWNIFLEYPILGVGVGGFRPAMKSRVDRYQVTDNVLLHKYVHNQYLAALATRGIPGLILLLLVMLLPIYIAMRHKSFEQGSSIAQISIIVVCLTYAIGSLVEDHFEYKPTIILFSVMIPMLLARISRDPQRQVKSVRA